jgi:hypothetical protein
MTAAAAAQLPESGFAAAPAPARGVGVGYGKDPDLLATYAAGDLWPLTFTARQRRTARALCDTIIPADGDAPSASAVATHEFIDEWISAPYPDCQRDRELILEGLAWLDQEANRRYGREYAALDNAQASSICDEICDEARAPAKLARPAAFFRRFRALTAIGYYTTPVGMKDLRYVGNQPLTEFAGPPPEVLKRLGLA